MILSPIHSVPRCLPRWGSIAIVGLIAASCAMKVAPTGGPRDTTPAEVMYTTPANGDLNVSNNRLRIEFSDYVDRGVRNAITVQPKVRFSSSYSGNEIEITFEEDLQPNTTYSVTLGTDWRDLRGNSPTRAASVTFSTGADIDTGRIEGTVHAADLKNVVVLLYTNADTLSADFSPTNRFARYQMPVGSSGAFTIAGLKDGTYRVVAIQDANANTLLDGNEAYAMATEDVTIRQGAVHTLTMLMGPSVIRMLADTTSADTTSADSIPSDTTSADTTEKASQQPGRLEGSFVVQTDLKGPYLARFIERSGTVTAVVRLRNGEAWSVEAIPPGTYTVDLVIDANLNDRYDHGTPIPFGFAERWVPLNLTVSVRQRWTTEGIKIVVAE